MIQVNLHKYAPQLPEELVSAVVNSAIAVWTVVPDELRPGVLKAYTETLRLVYVIGVPAAGLALAGALLIRNSKMQSAAEEKTAIAAAREKEALAAGDIGAAEKGGADAEVLEKGGVVGAAPDAATAAAAAAAEGDAKMEAESDRREAEEAVTMGAVAPVPEGAVDGGLDARALLDTQQGRSAV